MAMKDVYLEHNVGRPYIEKNYKDALRSLEGKGEIRCEPPATRRPPGTIGPETIITFLQVRLGHVA